MSCHRLTSRPRLEKALSANCLTCFAFTSLLREQTHRRTVSRQLCEQQLHWLDHHKFLSSQLLGQSLCGLATSLSDSPAQPLAFGEDGGGPAGAGALLCVGAAPALLDVLVVWDRH